MDLDNRMRMVFYPAIIGWTLLGFWIAGLRIRIKKLEQQIEENN
jgi:heme exporter protein C